MSLGKDRLLSEREVSELGPVMDRTLEEARVGAADTAAEGAVDGAGV
jgi:hypothetical protein